MTITSLVNEAYAHICYDNYLGTLASGVDLGLITQAELDEVCDWNYNSVAEMWSMLVIAMHEAGDL